MKALVLILLAGQIAVAVERDFQLSRFPRGCDVLDVFAPMYFDPAKSLHAHEQLLARMKEIPSRDSQIDLLVHQVLSLPDATDAPAVQTLRVAKKMVESWQETNPRSNRYRALERAISLRLLLAGNVSRETTLEGIRILHEGNISFPESSPREVWHSRLIAFLISQGNQRELEDTADALTTNIMPAIEHQTSYHGQSYVWKHIPSNEFTHASALVGLDVLRAWMLNPESASHHLGTSHMVQIAEQVATQKETISGMWELGLPRPLMEALTGYLDPRIFPVEKRQPEIEKNIRGLVLRLGLGENPDAIQQIRPTLRLDPNQ